ncbi:MAG TPA: EAL domain-containing protein, partial [Bacillota bacterium]|nr:EAL domain-containing protein [Bacillota bacterium]
MFRLLQIGDMNRNILNWFHLFFLILLVAATMLTHYYIDGVLLLHDYTTSVALIFLGWLLSKKYSVMQKEIDEKQEELETNFKQLYTLIDSTSDFIVLKDGEGKWLVANQMAVKLFQLGGISWRGKSSKELSPYSSINSDLLSEGGLSENKAWKRRELYRFEQKFKNLDGNDIVFDIVKVPVFDADFQRKGMVVIGRDITEHKKVKEKLQDINVQMKAIILSSPLAIISLALDGTVMSWNPAAEKMFGWTEQETVGQLYPLLPDAYEQKALVEEFILNDNDKTEVEVTRKKKDGTHIDVSISTAHLYDSDQHTIGMIAIFSDITERNRALKNLKDIQFALDESAIVTISDYKGIIIYANDKICEISKYEKEELIGSNHRIVNSNYHSNEFFRDLWETIKSGKVWHGEVRNKAKDGSVYWVDTTIVPIMEEKSGHYQYVCIRSDITERKLVEEKIYQMAFHDPLTDLPNRRLFNKQLIETLNKAKEQNFKFAIMMIDLKRFKVINDSFGHDVGDTLLQQVAKRLYAVIPHDHLIARVGGDEFMLLTPPIHWFETIHLTADAILSQFIEPFWLNGREIYITPTIGISMFPDHGTELDVLTKRADLALYHGKKYLEQKYHVFKSDMDIQSTNLITKNIREVDILTLESELRKAISHHELELYFQPQVNIQTQQIVGMEALIRWKHPKWGMISPADFIPLAEETGLIIPIGKQVLEEACWQNKKWQDEGYKPFKIVVNLSTKQFLQLNLVEMINETLQTTGLEPQWLELEITESSIMEDTEYAIDVLNQFCTLGIQIAIDDFGTGYSSLSYLKKFPIHALKIDQSFIRELPYDHDDKNIVLA